jgi:flagellar hook protein FlgE
VNNTPGAQTNVSLDIDYQDSAAFPANFKLDFTRTQQYASDFLSSTQQDGFPTGQFQSVSVDKDGTLYANYSSGQSSIVGQVVLATFPSETSLVQDRNNQFVETAASGAPIINQPGKGGAGQVLGSSIETAGVDLTSEMIKLISAQRTYQANSEVVKRQDQIMQTVIGISQ